MLAVAIRDFDGWAARVGVRGTPTIVVDGIVMPTPPSSIELDSLVRDRLTKPSTFRIVVPSGSPNQVLGNIGLRATTLSQSLR